MFEIKSYRKGELIFSLWLDSELKESHSSKEDSTRKKLKKFIDSNFTYCNPYGSEVASTTYQTVIEHGMSEERYNVVNFHALNSMDPNEDHLKENYEMELERCRAFLEDHQKMLDMENEEDQEFNCY